MKNFKISSKITLIVTLVVAFSLVLSGLLAYNLRKKAVKRIHGDKLNLLVAQKVYNINEKISEIKKNAQNVASLIANQNSSYLNNEQEYTQNDPFEELLTDSDPPPTAKIPNYDIYLKSINKSFEYSEIAIIDQYGSIVSSSITDNQEPSFQEPYPGFIQKAISHPTFSKPFINKNEEYSVIYSIPVANEIEELLRIVTITFDIRSLTPIVEDYSGLGLTGEYILASNDISGKRILILNKPRFDSLKTKTATWNNSKTKSTPLQKAIKGENSNGEAIDYRQKETLVSWIPIPEVNWGIIAKRDKDEIFIELKPILKKIIVAGIIILLLSVIVSVIFSKNFAKSIKSLNSTISLIGTGELPETIKSQSNDEIGQMAESVNQFVLALKRTAGFANKIGEGEFDASFVPLGDKDTLGKSLITMRDNLAEADKRDKDRNWIVTGVAEIGEILRMHDSLEDLGDEVIKYITQKINAIQGAFYIVEEDESTDFYEIQMKSSYAYNRKKYLKTKFEFAQGLVGQAAAEQDTVMRTEIPEDYVTITSGILGDQKPTCILIVPLITNEKVYGVLEFAGFHKFNTTQVKFIEELSVILARTVFNIKVNQHTRTLLEESQALSNELQEKQEVLNQNAEEMQATQEELKRSNTRLEEQIEEVNKSQNRMQRLLENASEVITIYEEDETIRYISPSVGSILGYTQEELVGIKDIIHVLDDYKEAVSEMFTTLIENPKEQVTIQYEYKTKRGNSIWLESTGTNFMSNPAIHGIIVNSTDITQRRRAEQEQRMRSKMQALSENSLDLITRLETDGPISYVNPTIESITGNAPSAYLNKNLEDTDIDKTIVGEWLKILSSISETNQKFSKEMDFPTKEGKRIMQVNAIPEFDEGENLESVLVVSHDITERKGIELEIQSKNKKINDSINYAKRIQGAILPNNTVIHKILPESFIFYKPKDVVSGDFPWYVRVGGDIFIAAVDCTGHGVPGALLSLIGYFLLNEIVRSRKISDPGSILDQLDEGVTSTLRQDQDDSKTKDGMDIALCKISKDKQAVEYAGAHRPLYVMKNGQMEEIKGNKFAIGGGIYKNQTKFTNNKIQLKKGDSFYFCSDGFPDQFGGPDNRKFGPKRTRELIKEVHDQSMLKAYNRFEHEWTTWKGNQKQTDDVLLIGIKF